MKKQIVLFLAICLCILSAIALVSCDSVDDAEKTSSAAAKDDGEADGENGDGSVTESGSDDSASSMEDAWNAAIQMSLFDNVTYSHRVNFLEGYSPEEMPVVDEMKFAQGQMTENGVLEEDAEMVSRSKTALLGSVVGMLKDYDRFRYDEETDSFSSTGEIVYTVQVAGIEATVTASDVQVFFDGDMHLSKVVCHMIQEASDGANSIRFVLDVEFLFTDYGTTVIE